VRDFFTKQQQVVCGLHGVRPRRTRKDDKKAQNNNARARTGAKKKSGLKTRKCEKAVKVVEVITMIYENYLKNDAFLAL